MSNVVPTFGAFEARHAENQIREQAYSHGVIGVVLLCGAFGSFYSNIRRLAQQSFKVIYLSIV